MANPMKYFAQKPSGSYPDDYYGMSGVPSSSFDFMAWIFKILKYWYLFLIVLVISLGLAYLKNKSWTPTYRTIATVLIEENDRQGFKSNMYPYSMSSGSRNNNINQMIMYGSHDFISKTVKRLNLSNEIYMKQRFKNTVLYKQSPIEIEATYIADDAYNMEFEIQGLDSTSYSIIFHGDKEKEEFRINGKYGESVQHALFFITVNKNERLIDYKYDLWFHFLSANRLIGEYSSKLSYRFLMEESSVLEISLLGKVAQRDVDFLNLLNDAYFTDNLAQKNLVAEKTISFIDEQLLIIRDSIQSSEAKLNIYQARSGVYSQDRSKSTNAVLDELDKRKADLRLKKEYMMLINNYLTKNQDDEVMITPTAFQINDQQLNMLVNQYNNLTLSMKSQGPTNPVYKRNKSSLDDVKKGLKESLNVMDASIGLEDANLNQRYSKAWGEIASLPQKERGLLNLERDYKINDAYYSYLLQRRTESQIQRASNMPDNRIVDTPRTVAVVNGSDKMNNYIYFVLGGLALTLLFVICRESIFRFSVQSRDEIESISQFPILGMVETTSKTSLIPVYDYPKSGFAESFRAIRSRMEYLTKKEVAITMLITSTEPKDGKTFVALNLASIYNQMPGRKTIIVDMDLRRPALSQALGYSNERGVSNYLIGHAGLDDLVVTHDKYGFDVLPAGTAPPNPSELIASEETKALLKELSFKYDYIILDCSPVGLVSDAHFLSRQADVTLYVVRNDKTNRNFFKYTIQEMAEDNINNVAIIYNGVKTKGAGIYSSRGAYGRGLYYHKHDSYYHEETSKNHKKTKEDAQ